MYVCMCVFNYGFNKLFVYMCVSINQNVVEKFIYFSNSTQIVKLVYEINSVHTDCSSLCLWCHNEDGRIQLQEREFITGSNTQRETKRSFP